MGVRSPVDVVVIGGGVVGCSSAYALALAGASVTVVEAGELASAASGASAGGVRQQGRDPRELPIAMRAIARWPGLAEELGADLDYRQDGHLTLVEREQDLPVLEARVRDEQARGLAIRVIAGDELRDLVPGLAPAMLAGAWCPTDGHAMPILVTKAFAAAAGRLGATILEGTAATAIRVDRGRVVAVETAAGRIGCDAVLIAAGAWSARLTRPLGIDLPIETRALQMMVTDPMPPQLKPVVGCVGRGLSLKQLPGGAYLLGGGWPGEVDEERRLGRTLAPSMVGSAVHGSAVYLPLLAARVVRAWTGLEAIAADEVPILGPLPGIEGAFVACGFSGHGFALAPCVGELMAELITTGRSSIPLEPLGLQRFADR